MQTCWQTVCVDDSLELLLTVRAIITHHGRNLEFIIIPVVTALQITIKTNIILKMSLHVVLAL